MSVLRVHNSLSRKLEEFVPADPALVTFYSCGPTVYDDAHIGNFRSFLAADVLRRFVESPMCVLRTPGGGEHAGPRRVVHVMNITDVGHMTDDAEGGESGEDRMAVAGRRLAEAKKSGKLPADAKIDPGNPYDIAGFYADRFLEDARKLGLKVAMEQGSDATLMPRATASIAGMIAVIRVLIERGHAYAVGEPGRQTVYFHVPSFGPYGTLSGNSLDKLSSGAGGRISESNQAQKKHPADFLLWKADPGHIMKWDSPWGAGYPGWHIECTVMSAARLLGAPANAPGGDALAAALSRRTNDSAIIDIHSGGEDNIFPHHECEIAQSACAFNADPARGTFARLWFHPRHLFVNSEKMSKSKGNFFTIRDLMGKGYEPAAIRLELIRTHYRSNANFTEQGLQDCTRMVERWRRARLDLVTRFGEAQIRSTPKWESLNKRIHMFRVAFQEAMMDDLNIAEGIAELNLLADSIMKAESDGLTADASRFPNLDHMFRWYRNADVFAEVDPILGVLERERPAATSTEIGVYQGIEPSPEVEGLLAARREARARKDYAAGDAIRDRLTAMGLSIKDMPGGRVEVRRG